MLGVVALIRPLLNILGLMDAVPGGPVLVTVLISLMWIAVVGLSGTARAFQTLVLAGLAYGTFAIALSAVLSPILIGELQGPVANPIAIPSVLIVNALWGAVAGVVALGVQRVRFGRDVGARQ